MIELLKKNDLKQNVWLSLVNIQRIFIYYYFLYLLFIYNDHCGAFFHWQKGSNTFVRVCILYIFRWVRMKMMKIVPHLHLHLHPPSSLHLHHHQWVSPSSRSVMWTDVMFMAHMLLSGLSCRVVCFRKQNRSELLCIDLTWSTLPVFSMSLINLRSFILTLVYIWTVTKKLIDWSYSVNFILAKKQNCLSNKLEHNRLLFVWKCIQFDSTHISFTQEFGRMQ